MLTGFSACLLLKLLLLYRVNDYVFVPHSPQQCIYLWLVLFSLAYAMTLPTVWLIYLPQWIKGSAPTAQWLRYLWSSELYKSAPLFFVSYNIIKLIINLVKSGWLRCRSIASIQNYFVQLRSNSYMFPCCRD